MSGLQEVQLVAGLKLLAFPATRDILLLAAKPDLAERRSAPVTASRLAAQSDQCPQHFIALLIVVELLEVRG